MLAKLVQLEGIELPEITMNSGAKPTTLSFEIGTGELVLITGGPKSGKSALLRLMGVIQTQNVGTLRLVGREVKTCTTLQRRRFRKSLIGYFFSTDNLMSELRVNENIELPLQQMGILLSQRERRVNEILDDMGITELAEKFPYELNDFERCLVRAARSLMVSPRIVLADEPTIGLTDEQGLDVIERMRKAMRPEASLILASSSLFFEKKADRVIYLPEGRMAMKTFMPI